MIRPVLKPGDWAAILLLAVILAILVVGFVAFPSGLESRVNFGFGPGWRCSPVPQGDPVCVKERKAGSSAPEAK